MAIQILNKDFPYTSDLTNDDDDGVCVGDDYDEDDDYDDDNCLTTGGESVQGMHPTHREGQTLALTCHYEAIIVMMTMMMIVMLTKINEKW